MDTTALIERREQLETERLRLEVERLELALQVERDELKLAKRTENLRLRKLSANLRTESAKLSHRTGRLNLDDLRKEITAGLLTNKTGVRSTRLREASYAWRKLLIMLRHPDNTPERAQGEAILKQLNVVYFDGDPETGKGYARTFYYEPKNVSMMAQGEVKVW